MAISPKFFFETGVTSRKANWISRGSANSGWKTSFALAKSPVCVARSSARNGPAIASPRKMVMRLFFISSSPFVVNEFRRHMPNHDFRTHPDGHPAFIRRDPDFHLLALRHKNPRLAEDRLQ